MDKLTPGVVKEFELTVGDGDQVIPLERS